MIERAQLALKQALGIEQITSFCEQPRQAPVPAAAATPSPTPDERPVVVYLGDSLAAADGVDGDRAWPALVGAALAEGGLDVRSVNAGVSGDTTAGGLARLDWLLAQDSAILEIEAQGARAFAPGIVSDPDMLRGLIELAVSAAEAVTRWSRGR